MAYAEIFAFGSSDNFSATGLSQAQENSISAEVTKNLMAAFKDYPLSDRNISALHAKYISKLKAAMNIQIKIKKKNKRNPVVEVTAATVNADLAKRASINENLLALSYEMHQRQNEGATFSTLKNDLQFQNTTFQALSSFIDRLPLNKTKTFEVACKIIEGYDGNFYYAPENPDALKNFLTANFVIDVNDGQEQFEQFFGFVINSEIENPEKEISDIYNKNDTWTIYWYMCGTNLESDGQSATNDIKEMEQVKLPPNVKILIQTGTTSKWHHNKINANGRYIYDSKGLKRISKNNPNMYEAATLQSFLEYGEKKYPADHKILIFWDHGGVGGVCQDQENTNNSLSLNDIRNVLENYKSPQKVPFEIIGFDTCLMGSYECAKTIEGFAKYMVASEAPENQYGWYYTDWLNELAKHPESNGEILGQKICSGSMEDCERHTRATGNDYVRESTFSVVNMSKLDKVSAAHKNFFAEALNLSNEIPNFSTNFDLNVKHSKINSYGDTYIDLKNLAESSKKLLPNTSDALVTAINDVIVGEPINGYVYRGSGGLSTYYPYTKNDYSYYLAQNAALPEQKSFYNILLHMNDIPSSSNSDESDNSNAPRSQKSADTLQNFPLMNVPVKLDENKHIYTQLTPEQLQLVSSVRCMVLPSVQFANAELGVKDEGIVVLGNDVDFKGDWQSGIFHDNFRNVWASIDGHLIFMAVTFSTSEYNIYTVPIKLNGEERTLEISYNYKEKKYSLLGARKKMERGIASKNVRYIEEGDEVTPLFLVYAPKENSDEIFEITEGEPFTISGTPVIEDKTLLGYGKCGYCFQFYGPGETFLGNSQSAIFEIEDAQIVNTLLVEDRKEDTEEIQDNENIVEDSEA